MATKLLKKFFTAKKTMQLRREIQTFQQKDGNRHESTSMGYFSTILIITYLKMIRYKPSMLTVTA
jgi:hypothetical protein